MPFKSDKQRKWMYANEPEMAAQWSAEEKMNKPKRGQRAATNKQKQKQRDQASHIRSSSASNQGGAAVGGGTSSG
jgi:hypothetical protein